MSELPNEQSATDRQERPMPGGAPVALAVLAFALAWLVSERWQAWRWSLSRVSRSPHAHILD